MNDRPNAPPLDQVVLLDPTDERTPAARQRSARPESLEGRTIALLDISKPRGDVYLDRLEALFAERGIRVERLAKPTFTRPAPPALLQGLKGRVDLVVEGLAD